jgi:hypothetical protein
VKVRVDCFKYIQSSPKYLFENQNKKTWIPDGIQAFTEVISLLGVQRCFENFGKAAQFAPGKVAKSSPSPNRFVASRL